jgi:peptidoglycan-associated lipoprotein
MPIRKFWLTGLIIMVMLGGCATRGGSQADQAGTVARAGSNRAARAGQYPGGAGYGERATDGDNLASGPLARRIIYFAYDSDDVLPESLPVVTAHAEYLASHGESSAVLEGHADERGSAEYNIALGERRAKSVERILRLQGVGGDQLRIVSYGEEKPAVSGHEESFWQQNRRVEIVYSDR